MTLTEILITIAAIATLATLTAAVMVITFRMWKIGKQPKAEPAKDPINHFEGYFDKFGHPVSEDNVIWDGFDLYRVYWNPVHPQIEGFSITAGYIHNLTRENMAKFTRVGTFYDADEEAWCALRDKMLAKSHKEA